MAYNEKVCIYIYIQIYTYVIHTYIIHMYSLLSYIYIYTHIDRVLCLVLAILELLLQFADARLQVS